MAIPKRSRSDQKLNMARNQMAEDTRQYQTREGQLSLFELPVAANSNGQTPFRDPAFGDNKNLPVHRWVPWIAGYSVAFVDDVISAYLTSNVLRQVQHAMAFIPLRTKRPSQPEPQPLVEEIWHRPSFKEDSLGTHRVPLPKQCALGWDAERKVESLTIKERSIDSELNFGC